MVTTATKTSDIEKEKRSKGKRSSLVISGQIFNRLIRTTVQSGQSQKLLLNVIESHFRRCQSPAIQLFAKIFND